MSEELSLEQLDALKVRWALNEETPEDNLLIAEVFSMACRTLKAEDDLLQATAMLQHQKYCRECAESWDSCEEGRKADQFLTEFHEKLKP